MAFDWLAFLNRRGIDYSEKGPSATTGNISIKCPFCGSSDRSMHMAISIRGRGWRCFRNPRQHRGRSPVKLIQALLGCSWEEAFRIAGVSSIRNTVDGKPFNQHVATLLRRDTKTNTDEQSLRLLPAFKPLLNIGSGRYFANYLVEKRDYRFFDISNLCAEYGLHYALTGPFAWRIIFPIYMNDRLVCWIGRTLSENTNMRYRTLSADPENAERDSLPLAVMSVEHTLLNHDQLRNGGEELIVCEGPFDAMRIDYFGADFGVRATCVYTKSISDEQISLLSDIGLKFARRTLLFDTDTQLDDLRSLSRVAHLDFRVRHIPNRYKDPAELPRNAVYDLIGV
jgi:hypothetical protein